MILDSGICTVFHPEDLALSGEMPRPGYRPLTRGWYGETSFATTPASPTDGRRELRVDAKIRILQCRAIRQDDVVILRNLETFEARERTDTVYRIIRAFHGTDDDGPTPITDLSLEVISP